MQNNYIHKIAYLGLTIQTKKKKKKKKKGLKTDKSCKLKKNIFQQNLCLKSIAIRKYKFFSENDINFIRSFW